MPIVPVADFVPDRAAYGSDGLQVATNVFPREDGSDGPLSGPAQLASALAAPCLGAFLASGGVGTSSLVAGTETKLYVINGTTWSDRSSAAYATPERWQFTQFGSRVIATNFANAMQTWVVGSGSNFANLSATAPKARYIATIEPGFVMVGDYDDGVNPRRNGVWWSALNDATSWPTPGTAAATSVQSDQQELPLGAAITGILPAIGGANGCVFTERSIYRIEYQGGGLIFSFREVDRSRGCFVPGSLIQVGSMAFFLSEEGFNMFDGSTVTPIGFSKVDRFFWDDVDARNLSAVRSTVDPIKRLIVWYYPATDGSPRWLIYNYANGRWRFGDDSSLAIQAFLDRVAPSIDETLIDLSTDAFGWGGVLAADDSGVVLQEDGIFRILVGSSRAPTFIAGFDSSNALVGYAGATLAATVETGETDAQGRRVSVAGVRPLTDAAGARVSVGYRDTFSSPVSYTYATAQENTGICPQRINARYARARITIPAGEVWTYLQGADVMGRGRGNR